MPDVLKHGYQPNIVDFPDPANPDRIGTTKWSAEHVFTGGLEGQILRWKGANSDKVAWDYEQGVSVLTDTRVKNDGTDATNTTAGIQAVLDAHPNVVFPPGTYAINGAVTIAATRHVRFLAGATISIGTGVTLTIEGSFEAPPYQIFSGLGSVSITGARVPVVYAEWWGAVGDGGTDDSGAFNACVNALPAGSAFTLRLLPRTYALASTVTITGRNPHIQGAGVQKSIFAWQGPTTGAGAVAIKITTTIDDLAVFYTVRDLAIINNVAAGATIGLFTTSHAPGSSNGNGMFENLRVQFFDVGMKVGEPSGESASEVTFINASADNCATYGFYIAGSNTLNLNFFNLFMSFCGTGIRFDGVDECFVYGGSSSNNTLDFECGAGGIFTIQNFRSENAQRCLAFASTSAYTHMTLIGNTFQNSVLTDVVYTLGGNFHLTAIGNRLDLGQFQFNGIETDSSATLMGNTTTMTAIANYAVGAGQALRVFLKHNARVGLDGLPLALLPDQEGVVIDAALTAMRQIDYTAGQVPAQLMRVEVVATGSLPAAGAAQDGRFLIEDAGTGDRNLIIYAGGQRFRIDGGAAV